MTFVDLEHPKADLVDVATAADAAYEVGHFPDGKGARGVVAPLPADAIAYAARIKSVWVKSVEATLQVAETVHAARSELDDGEFSRLAELLGISLSRLSKLCKIHERSSRFEHLEGKLPAGWTSLYALAKLDDHQFARLREAGRVRPDVTVEDIDDFFRGSRTAGSGHDTPVLPEHDHQQPYSKLPTTIMIPTNLAPDRVETIKRMFIESVKGWPVQIVFHEGKGRAQEQFRASLLPLLQEKLQQSLATSDEAGRKLSSPEREAVYNAAWQFHHKKQKGNYPYPSSDPRSVQHADHPYSVHKYKDQAAFLKHLRAEKIVTPYSPLSRFTELGEARCIRHALEYCSAGTSKVRQASKERLEDIVAKEPTLAETAQHYLNVITGRESIDG
jgi:hypothetical protein